MQEIITLLNNYIKIAYEVNALNANINALKNCSYSKYITVVCELMQSELADKIEESHKASQTFLSAVYILKPEEKELLAVLLNEKAARHQKRIEELLCRLSDLEQIIGRNNGVVPNIAEGVIPMSSPKRNAKHDEFGTQYLKLFKELEEHEFAYNLSTNYAAYLGYTRTQERKK